MKHFLLLVGILSLLSQQTFSQDRSSQSRLSDPRSKILSKLPVATIPFESVSNLIFVLLQVNGSKPVWFVVDSGASGWVLDQEYAKQIGLKTEGKGQGSGAGAGKIDMTYTANVTYTMPGAFTMTVDRSIVLDFGGLQSKVGHEFSGLVGFEFFRDFVVAVHYDSSILRLYDPAQYEYTGSGEILPIVMKKNLPYVELGLQVKGAERQNKEILIDTGSADSIDNDLIAQSTAPRLTAIGGIGLGQEFRIQLGHYESVQLGKLNFKNVAGASGASLMGGEFLHRFTAIFNYQKNQLIFEPNRHVEDVYLFNASGLDIKDSKDGVEITGILKGFPAEIAGFQEGDVITAIDGYPISNFRFQHLVQILHEGGQYWFTTSRNGTLQTRKLMIPPAPQIPW